MKRYLILLSLVSLTAWGDQAQMNTTLVQAIAELQHVKPLIAQAEAENPAGSNIQFESFTGPDGKRHNGIQDDLNAITDGLIQIADQAPIDPKPYPPIAGDYAGGN